MQAHLRALEGEQRSYAGGLGLGSEMGGPRPQLQTAFNSQKHKEIRNGNACHDMWLR